MEKGRFREFYQCDFDIAGDFKFMMADAECVKIGTTVLDALDVGKYIFKLNHRQLLDGIFAVCGVPEEKLRTICSAVDKLDKAPWEEVKVEMLQKGLDSDTADRIWGYVQRKGGLEVVDDLEQDELL
jgi:histidyl-tRNA synthetase